MLNDYIINLVSVDCFPLFLQVLISLIKLILWLKFSTDKRQAENMVGVGWGEGPWGPAPFHMKFPKSRGPFIWENNDIG